VNELARSDLIKAWSAIGVHFPEDPLNGLRERDRLQLMKCTSCGFRFFDPALVGDANFYSALHSGSKSYYVSERDEFKWALKIAARRGLKRVLDVGCGEGAFLNLARKQSLQTSGLELNSQAANICRRNGHHVYSCLLTNMKKEPTAPHFDLITAFQVLEHVSSPVEFLRDAAELLTADGCIAVAVPNEHGVVRLCPFDPHQWPPHHISRWRLKDLHYLGRICGLEVVDHSGDILHGGEIAHFWNLHNRLASVLDKKRHPGSELAPAVISFFYRNSGMKFIFPRRGPSIYALFKK
jgi:SAM-dependent methyltransferase